jgi:hypothetical protein
MGADAPCAESKLNVYYPVIAEAVSRLRFNDRVSRQIVYDKAQATLVRLSRGDLWTEPRLEREMIALEAAIQRFEASISQEIARQFARLCDFSRDSPKSNSPPRELLSKSQEIIVEAWARVSMLPLLVYRDRSKTDIDLGTIFRRI